ncbi:MAG: APC family permease [Actinomycetaceae bacterium]|nr:APC family permease [Actinomycetaceae bacterium]
MMGQTESTTSMTIARTASLTLVALAALTAPQVVLRSVSSMPGAELWIATGMGLLFFVIMMGLLWVINRATPRRSMQQNAFRHIGSWAGLIVAAAQILAYALLIMLGVAVVTTALTAITHNDKWTVWMPSVIVLLLAIPIMSDKLRTSMRVAGVLAFAGTLVLLALLIYGLVQEALGNIDFQAIRAARLESLQSQIHLDGVNPYVDAALGALFPSAILLLTSERILVDPKDRRVPTRKLARIFVPLFIIILLTTYFIDVLMLPGRRTGIPAMSIGAAFFGDTGQAVLAIVFSIVGIVAAYTAYRQLPRFLRELALDGLLPRHLAARDANRPRRLVVITIGFLAAVATWVLDSMQAVAMAFIFVCFLIAFVSALAFVFRGRSILDDSTEAHARRQARIEILVFIGFALISVTVVVLLAWVQPYAVLTASLCLVVPTVFLWTYRRGQGRVHEVLSASADPHDRRIPTRIHGLVLIERCDQPAIKAVSWARAARLSSLRAVVIDVLPAQTRRVREDWEQSRIPVSLTVLGTPRGAFRGPLIEYVRSLRAVHPHDIIQVFIPRVMSTGSWERFYVSHTTPKIVSELRLEPGVMVTEVPYRLDGVGRSMNDDHEERIADLTRDSHG